MSPIQDQYDYIVIGAGSAGCVIANRLSADPANAVLLIEAGPMDHSPVLKMPAAFTYAINSATYDWRFMGEPEPYLNNRRLTCNRGRVVGGSSSINALCYVRGHPLDFDRWAVEVGDDTWAYKNCLPYFKKLESYSSGGDTYRGNKGPLKVLRPEFSNPLNQVFADAAAQAGYPWNPDTNGELQEGFGKMDQTINQGMRQSASVAYLHPATDRPNLTLLCNTHVQRILFEGNQCTGVKMAKDGRSLSIRATKEVVLSAGAISSPALLMLSGIGPSAHLYEHGISMVHHSPDVGQNLQDHVNVNVQYASLQAITATPFLRLHRKIWLGLQWLFSRKGPGATNHFEIAGYLNSQGNGEVANEETGKGANERIEETTGQPDLQFLFFPLLADDSGKPPKQKHGFQVAISTLGSDSKGEVKLNGKSPSTPPSIRFNYLGSETEKARLRNGIRLCRDIFGAPAFEPYLGDEVSPGADVSSNAALDRFIVDNLRSTKHPCGTCRMGSDPDAVVDSAGRVQGVSGLRVADASIMPSITSGNINAPVLMIAEKIAQKMLENETVSSV